MPVKVRVEVHEEWLRGSSHVEDPHYTVSPAAQRLLWVVLWGPAQTASVMYTLDEMPLNIRSLWSFCHSLLIITT